MKNDPGHAIDCGGTGQEIGRHQLGDLLLHPDNRECRPIPTGNSGIRRREGPADGLLWAGSPSLCDKQSQVRAGSDQRAIDLALRDPGRCAGLAVAERGTFIAAQLLGLARCRYILRLEPLASLPSDDRSCRDTVWLAVKQTAS